MKKYHFYSVSLGYSSIALVKIKSLTDFLFIYKYAPAGSSLGKLVFLCRLVVSILVGRYAEYEIPELEYNSHSCFILIPWSQSRNEKYCLIKKGSFTKHSKSKGANYLLNNEYAGAVKFSTLINTEEMFIQIPKLINEGEYTVLEYPLIRGKRCKELLDVKFNHCSDISPFYSSNYYMMSKKYLDCFLKVYYFDIYENLFGLLIDRPNMMVNNSPMHGDFSNSNILDVSGMSCLIDFEEYVEDGIDIELSYYKFRYQFDRDKFFIIASETDLLCVYHYMYFQSKNESHFTFENIEFKNNKLRLLL